MANSLFKLMNTRFIVLLDNKLYAYNRPTIVHPLTALIRWNEEVSIPSLNHFVILPLTILLHTDNFCKSFNGSMVCACLNNKCLHAVKEYGFRQMLKTFHKKTF